MALEDTIAIEVVYALSERQIVVSVSVPPGTTVREAIELARAQVDFGEAGDSPVGIYGRLVSRDALLSDGDRVEIYRPLVADAKQARRRRVGRKAV
jgi:putative ubiquitin-RnfH superfamily antitoxin RatB of RatAB toxin-antitoxin module